MKNHDELGIKILYALGLIILIWGILASLFVAGKELCGAIGQGLNWEFGKQFFVQEKGIGLHVITGLFLIAVSGFLIWMGQKLIRWIQEDTKHKKALKYKRRNYR